MDEGILPDDTMAAWKCSQEMCHRMVMMPAGRNEFCRIVATAAANGWTDRASTIDLSHFRWWSLQPRKRAV